MSAPPESHGTIALFVTCLVDLMRPEVGFAAAALVERAGFRVVVPEGQTCCGQPNFNGGVRGGRQGGGAVHGGANDPPVGAVRAGGEGRIGAQASRLITSMAPSSTSRETPSPSPRA
jgi:hypothetical protein